MAPKRTRDTADTGAAIKKETQTCITICYIHNFELIGKVTMTGI